MARAALIFWEKAHIPARREKTPSWEAGEVVQWMEKVIKIQGEDVWISEGEKKWIPEVGRSFRYGSLGHPFAHEESRGANC